jgi:hypothetical protein
VSGMVIKSLKLLLAFNISRFYNLPIVKGSDLSSLKWTSKTLNDSISQIEDGRDLRLFKWKKYF